MTCEVCDQRAGPVVQPSLSLIVSYLGKLAKTCAASTISNPDDGEILKHVGYLVAHLTREACSLDTNRREAGRQCGVS